jgi:hypothetical protein
MGYYWTDEHVQSCNLDNIMLHTMRKETQKSYLNGHRKYVTIVDS